jgi:glycosyltransferase involved in cell wall biosynthesis
MPETALIISATAPDPADTGKRVVLRGLIRYLVDRLGPDNVHYALVGADSMPPISFPVRVHHLAHPTLGSQLAALARSLTRPDYPLQEAMLHSGALRRQVRELVAQVNPSIEIYDTARMSQHVPQQRGSRRRILYVDDLFSVRYARMLAMADRETVDIDPLGGFADNVPGPLRSLARRPSVYLPLLRFERARLERREPEIVRGFDASLLVNADEVELLRQRSGSPDVELFTPLLPEVLGLTRAPVADPPELVFLGNLFLPHNEDAASTFLRTVLPAIERDRPPVRLRIIGRNAGAGLRELAARFPNSVVLEGFVEDLDAALSRATAVIGPLRFGSGVKIKMLEALARGVPLLATGVAAEGIPIRTDGGDGAIIEDDLGRWPGLIRSLTDPDRNHRMSAAALDFFDRTYSNDVVTRQYDSVFELSPARAS